jgi:hypothetical protein
MTGDCHVRFCERLRGETPLCLLGALFFLILPTLFFSCARQKTALKVIYNPNYSIFDQRLIKVNQ